MLTVVQVQEIRDRYAAGGISQQALADEYGVRQNTISRIVLRKVWMHVN
jgi:predicted transcriptional regulator